MKIYNSMLKITLLAVLNTACAAQYQTIKDPEAAGTQGPNEDATPNVDEPQAGVEVVYQDRVVMKVPVNVPFTIRPTPETMDLDDRDVEDCQNPGIVSANYNIEGYSESALREDGECSDLGITYTANDKGILKVTLEVESDENEIASASIEIEVVDLEDMPPPDENDTTNGNNSNNGDGSSDTNTNNKNNGDGSSSTGGNSNNGGGSNNTGGGNNDGDGSSSTANPTTGNTPKGPGKGGSNPGQHSPGQSPQQSK